MKDKVKVYIPSEESLDKTYLTSMDEHYFEFIFYDDKSIININSLEISFKPNPHPILTYSIKVKDNKHTLVYSSDTGYQNNTLKEFARDADLLICETTFLTSQKDSNDNHLTTIEAGLIATKAQVKKLMITHTWPETDKNIYLKETKEVFKNTVPAQTGKVLKLGR